MVPCVIAAGGGRAYGASSSRHAHGGSFSSKPFLPLTSWPRRRFLPPPGPFLFSVVQSQGE